MAQPDRVSQRQRRSTVGLWLLAALALVVVLLIATAVLKTVSAQQRAALETDALATAAAEKAPAGADARPDPAA